MGSRTGMNMICMAVPSRKKPPMKNTRFTMNMTQSWLWTELPKREMMTSWKLLLCMIQANRLEVPMMNMTLEALMTLSTNSSGRSLRDMER